MEKQVNAKETEIIVRIAKRPDATQRELASETGISLGMTNIILKRLVRKGHVKMKRLNRRNIRYVLTPDGLARYTRRSYDFLLRTVSSVRQLKGRVKQVVKDEARKGAPGFVIQGEGELADIAELALREISSEIEVCWTRGENRDGWVQLMCDTSRNDPEKELSRSALAPAARQEGLLDLTRAIVEGEL